MAAPNHDLVLRFTLATMHMWIRSNLSRPATLHQFSHGRCPGSGPGARVIAKAGLDGDGQLAAIMEYVERRTADARPAVNRADQCR